LSGSCIERRGGEKWVHREWTILVIRLMLLLDEQINLRYCQLAAENLSKERTCTI
jgi:hypothetical protein